MFTDLVGYSSLTQKDEALALELLQEHRRLLRPIFTKHEGREIETAGDSFFVEFNSAVEATECAIEIQTTLYERNKVEPKDKQILLRIGLHIGDVVYLENHVHGDGVNIAARIEPLARPGGICVSEDVARQIRNKIPNPVIKLSREKLKNISMPMDIYAVALPWQQLSAQRKNLRVSRPLWVSLSVGITVLVLAYFLFFAGSGSSHGNSISRLAVLPLDNISLDSSDQIFADGMTEELISSLSKIRGLNVIARTSIMKYKDMDKDPAEIGRELMVTSILDGSVRRIANKARIYVQLIDVSSQESLWSDEYDRELEDIFEIQSEIAQNVANELQVRLLASEKEQLNKNVTTSMAAFQDYLVGKYYLNQRTPETIHKSVQYFENAVKLDPQFAVAYSNLAYAYTLIAAAGYGSNDLKDAAFKAKHAVRAALNIDPKLAEAHAALGYILFRIDWDWAGAEKEFKRAIDLKPGYCAAHEWYALLLAINSRLDESLEEMQKAVELDPMSPNVNTGLARIYHFRGELDKALTQIHKTIQMDPTYAEAHFTEGMTYFRMGQYERALAPIQRAIDLSGRRTIIVGMLGAIHARMGNEKEAQKLLAELETVPITNDKLYGSVIIKGELGVEKEEVMKGLEKLVHDKYGVMVYLKVEKDFFSTSKDPRYWELVRKMNL